MVALLEAMGTDVPHPGPIDDVVLGVGAGAIVEALARLDLLLGLWLVPCFGRLGREVEELRLDGFFLGCEQLGSSDGVSGGSILPSTGSVCGWSGRDARVLMTCPSSFAVGSRCGL